VAAEKLRAAGIRTTEGLLQAGGTRNGRAQLAAATGLDAGALLEWVNHADLMRLKGVGSEYSDLLEEAGVDSCAELARRVPANLFAAIQEIITKQPNIVRRPPTQDMVNAWIAEAKTLPQVVEH
jgi:predicted flap endonuclease-1-like 5' DNA nuclease